MAKKRADKTDALKKATLAALEKHLGVVTSACKQSGIHRSTFYDWMDKDAKFAKQVEAVQEIALDFAESALHNQIKDGSTAATIFYLKTKGKKRGYIEKQEIDHSHKGKGLNLIIDIQNDDNSDA